MSKRPTRNAPATRQQPDEKPSDSVVEEIERQLDPVLQNLPKVQREQVLAKITTVIQTEVFSGPLPHPRHLAQYDQIIPNGAERILQMTERVIDHNIASSNDRVARDDKYRRLGMVLGFISFGVIIGAAVGVGVYGHTVLSGLLLASGVIGAVTAFIRGNGK